MSTFTDALNAQIGEEFAASQQYVAIAVWYDTQTLPQLARHFYRQAVEERNHAMIIVLLMTVERAVTSNILLAEDYLARGAIGDRGEAPNAPQAAGGSL